MRTSPSPTKRRRLDPTVPFNVAPDAATNPYPPKPRFAPLFTGHTRASLARVVSARGGKLAELRDAESRKRSHSISRGRSMQRTGIEDSAGKEKEKKTTGDEDDMDIDEEEARPKTSIRPRQTLQRQPQTPDAALFAQLQERTSFLRREIRHLETTIQTELKEKENQQDQQPTLSPASTDDELSSLISSLLTTSDRLLHPAPKPKSAPKATQKTQTILTNIYPRLLSRADPLPELSSFNTLAFTTYSYVTIAEQDLMEIVFSPYSRVLSQNASAPMAVKRTGFVLCANRRK